VSQLELPSPVQAELKLPDENATNRLGALLARALLLERDRIDAGGCVLGLSGDLGAGKTSLVRALLREMGVKGAIKSPTFALLEPYIVSRLNFHHFDFYRFTNPDEFWSAGFRELFGPGSIAAIEWPERAAGLPTQDLALALVVMGDGRRCTLAARTELGAACLQSVIASWPGAGA